MAFKIASTLIGFIAGAADLGAAFGFSAAAEAKQKELQSKMSKLKTDAEDAGDLYDRVYYFVNANMKRMMNAIEQLPDDFLTEIDKSVKKVLEPAAAEKVFTVMATYLGVAGLGLSTISGAVKAARKIRAKLKASNKTEAGISGDADNPWRDLSNAEAAPTRKGTTTRSKLAKKISLGVDVAGTVFSVGGLALTIGLGASTLSKLNDAIDDVEKKQQDVEKFKTAMTSVLNEIAEAAGLPRSTNYNELVKLFESVRKASEAYEEYSKGLKYAIKYYYRDRYTLAQIKERVQRRMDTTVDPLPDKAYVLASTLASGIREKFNQGKTDQEIINFYNDDNPTLEQRFVLDEYFLSDLRWDD